MEVVDRAEGTMPEDFVSVRRIEDGEALATLGSDDEALGRCGVKGDG